MPSETNAPDLPYAPRPGQTELRTAARQAFTEGRQALLEAGTGTGKTVAVLAAALDASAETDRTIIYLTRTNSQQRQAIIEFKRLATDRKDPKTGRPMLALALQGRHNNCPELRNDARYHGADGEEYARLCGSRKRRSLENHNVPNLTQAWQNGPEHDAAGYDPDLDDDGHLIDPEVLAAREREQSHPHGNDPRNTAIATTDPGPGKRKPLPELKTADRASGHNGCPYYDGLIEANPRDLLAQCTTEPRTSEALAKHLEDQGICPYEATKALLPHAKLIVAPYVYLADPRLATALQDWMRRPLSDCIIIIDEAHNLPDYLRELHSPALTLEALRRARSEAAGLSDPKIAPDCPTTRFIDLMTDILEYAANQRVPGDRDDALVPPDLITTTLMERLNTTSRALDAATMVLQDLGEQVRRAEERRGRLPRSYLGSLGAFLQAWATAEPHQHVHMVVADDRPRLLLYCLDPAIGTRFLVDAHAAVHMSGTLRPLDQYRDVLGLGPDTHEETFPSPFADANRQIILLDDVTTRYETRINDPAAMDRLHEHIRALINTPGANTAIFFPSFEMLRHQRETGLTDALPAGRRIFAEDPTLDQHALMGALERFRDEGAKTRTGGPGAVWLGVMGGRVAEGMDFPGPALEVLALVGLPYPKPTSRQDALVRYYDIRFGRGWDYAVNAPTVRRVLQAIGRVIRDQDDHGLVFLLDDRYRRLATHLPRMEAIGAEETVADQIEAWVEVHAAGNNTAAQTRASTDGPTSEDAGFGRASDLIERDAAE